MTERKPAEQQKSMETLATRSKKANVKPAKLTREVQARLGQQLRNWYDDVVGQGVPDRFVDLVNRIDGNQEKSGQ